MQGSKGHTVFAKLTTDQMLRGNSYVARVAVQEKVRKIEKVLEVMTDVEGPAVHALRVELKRFWVRRRCQFSTSRLRSVSPSFADRKDG